MMPKSSFTPDFRHDLCYEEEDFKVENLRQMEQAVKKEYTSFPNAYTDWQTLEVNATALEEWLVNDFEFETDYVPTPELCAEVAFCFAEMKEEQLLKKYESEKAL